MSAKEAKFHGIFYTRLLDHIEENGSVFDEPVSEQSTESGSADIYVPSALSGELVIEVKRDDIYPRDHDVVRQARDYANELGTDFFATCNSNDLFLFHYQGEVDLADVEFYYFNLRESDVKEAIPQILGIVENLYEGQSLPDQGEQERIVGILRSFHSSIWPTYTALAEKKHGQNEKFTQEFDTWARKNNYMSLDPSERFEIAGKQYAYLLTDKVLFYDVVREKIDRGEIDTDVELEPLHGKTTLRGLDAHIKKQFDRIVERIDYKPVFDQGSSLFATYPENTKTLKTLNDFVTNVESESIVSLNEGLLGAIYEELIPKNERIQLGQFYTPEKVAETIVKWAVQEKGDGTAPRVLDPASGSGTFTVQAYKRLRDIFPDLSHQDLIENLVAIDINRFPLHLTALNLARQNIAEVTENLYLFPDDFFNFDPNTDRLFNPRLDGVQSREMGLFDAVVGNPPYINHRRLYPDTDHFRRHLSSLGPEGLDLYYEGEKRLSGFTDAYVYFVTHGTQFLRENGRLGFIIPTKWMMTGYGEQFQQFLYDNYKISAVVSFTARVFEDAYVDGALLLIERCSTEQERRANKVNFVRVKQELASEDIVDTAEYDYEIESDREIAIVNRDAYRTVAMGQDYLMSRDSGKLGHYLTAPQIFIEALENPKMTPLGNLISSSSRGVTTGDNGFFFIDKQDAEERGIDDRFLSPVLRWIKQMEAGEPLTTDITDLYVLDVHDYAEDALTRGGLEQSDTSERVKAILDEDEYYGLLNYIREGEARGVDEGKSGVWFDLGELEHADILHPKGFKYRIFASRNVDRLAANNRLYCLNVKDEIDPKALLGILNSTLYKGTVEAIGRSEGRGMLELSKGDLLDLPVLDVRQLSHDVQQSISEAYMSFEEGAPNAQDRLDEVIIEIAGLDIDVSELHEIQETLTNQRNERGTTAEVLVEKIDSFDDLGTRTFTVGADSDESNSDLSDYM